MSKAQVHIIPESETLTLVGGAVDVDHIDLDVIKTFASTNFDLKRGDVIRLDSYFNEDSDHRGQFLYDGENLVRPYQTDNYLFPIIPSEFKVVTEFPGGYWETDQSFFDDTYWLETEQFKEQLINNLRTDAMLDFIEGLATYTVFTSNNTTYYLILEPLDSETPDELRDKLLEDLEACTAISIRSDPMVYEDRPRYIAWFKSWPIIE